MHLRLAALLFATALPVAAHAQTATEAPVQTVSPAETAKIAAELKAKITVQQLMVHGASCPVGLQAERKATGRVYPALATVGNSAFDGPGLHLTFQQHRATEIASMNLIVHGFKRNPTHATPAATIYSGPDASQSFQLKADGKPLDHADLRLTQLATAQSVELTHIGFADGTEWNKSTHSQCVVELSSLLLIR